jgi:hypothetical protein
MKTNRKQKKNRKTVVISTTKNKSGEYKNVEMTIGEGDVKMKIGKVTGMIVGSMTIDGDVNIF